MVSDSIDLLSLSKVIKQVNHSEIYIYIYIDRSNILPANVNVTNNDSDNDILNIVIIIIIDNMASKQATATVTTIANTYL